jgi:hypothetical protein
MEETLIIEIWDTFRDYIPEKSRETAANQYVDYLLGKDVETSELEGVLGYDPHLDIAIELVLRESSEGEEDDDEDYSYNEDED